MWPHLDDGLWEEPIVSGNLQLNVRYIIMTSLNSISSSIEWG